MFLLVSLHFIPIYHVMRVVVDIVHKFEDEESYVNRFIGSEQCIILPDRKDGIITIPSGRERK